MGKNKKIKVGILFGGRSAEHEVSLQSAKNVFEAINKEKYEPVLIGIDKKGRWLSNDISEFFLNADNPKLIKLNQASEEVVLSSRKKELKNKNNELAVDVVFPILHGPLGEDGTVQGLLKLLDIPFVGAGVLGSAIGMDKDVMKRLLREARITIGKFIVLESFQIIPTFKKIKDKLGFPFFIKPANMGSSIGVTKVTNEKDYEKGIAEAFNFDTKIILEEFIKGREIECSVLGNKKPRSSVLGEIIPKHDFYSYDAKYIDEGGAILKIPAEISTETSNQIQKMAIKTFQVLSCEGLGRVDFFLKKDGEIIVNEINTIPGFTKVSMYPKLWEASGITYSELIDKLIQLAIQRFEREKINS